jgi:hypothetical protein
MLLLHLLCLFYFYCCLLPVAFASQAYGLDASILARFVTSLPGTVPLSDVAQGLAQLLALLLVPPSPVLQP